MRDRLLPFCLRMRSPRSSDSSAKIRWRWGVETQISGGNLTIVLELCTQIPKLDVAGSIPLSLLDVKAYSCLPASEKNAANLDNAPRKAT